VANAPASVLLLEPKQPEIAPGCYEPIAVQRLLAFAGIRDYRLIPAAAARPHQFAIQFASDQAARHGETQLRAIAVNGCAALTVDRSGLRIAASCTIAARVDASTQVECDGDHHWSRDNFFLIFRFRADADSVSLLSGTGVSSC
jgi:hypothetical protein